MFYLNEAQSIRSILKNSPTNFQQTPGVPDKSMNFVVQCSTALAKKLEALPRTGPISSEPSGPGTWGTAWPGSFDGNIFLPKNYGTSKFHKDCFRCYGRWPGDHYVNISPITTRSNLLACWFLPVDVAGTAGNQANSQWGHWRDWQKLGETEYICKVWR